MTDNKQTSHINVDYFENLTGDIENFESNQVEEIGKRIKKIRQEKNISQEELANLTGFNVKMLSEIENNHIKPQLGTIIKLSKALDSTLSRLISEVGDSFYSITRKNERKKTFRSTAKEGEQNLYSYKSLAQEVKGRHMEAMIVHLEENPEVEKSVHDGEEFIFVLDGTVILNIGDEKFELEKGDSVYYLSTIPHQLSAKQTNATILAVIYDGQ